MLENRSFDHMLGYLYSGAENVSPSGRPFEGLTGKDANPDTNGLPVTVFKIEPSTPNAYLMPGADPGEGYMATNDQLYGVSGTDPGGGPAVAPGGDPRGTRSPATCRPVPTTSRPRVPSANARPWPGSGRHSMVSGRVNR